MTAITVVAVGMSAVAQNVNIPDAVFKNYLLNNPAINTNGDDEIQESEAAAFTGTISYNGQSSTPINDLTGIEAFTALTRLVVPNNKLDSLDLSANTALTYLDCSYNVHSYTDDEDFDNEYSYDIGMNTLIINNCIALDTLICSGNGLDSLNISANTALTYLDCSNNINHSTWFGTGEFLGYQSSESYHPTLHSLEMGGATALTYLNCSGNQLHSLDISANTALVYVDCSENGGYSYSDYGGGSFGGDGSSSNYSSTLTAINTNGVTALTYLDCSGNALDSLNVSTNTGLTYLNCSNNRGHHVHEYYEYGGGEYDEYVEYYTPHLLVLNIKNGNNTLLSSFNAQQNDYLGCIKVDDVIYAQSNWSENVDPTANFSEEDCPEYEDIAVSVATQNNVPPEITTDMGTLQMVATVTPEAFTQQANWSIVPVTGVASVSQSGLVTALESGTVYVKATSAISPTKADSMLITISNQISVSVSTENNVPPQITVDHGTLQMTATVLPEDVNQQVIWSVAQDYDIMIFGDASISEDGLVTALEDGDGELYVIAESVLNPARRDTMLISISNQSSGIDDHKPSANNLFSLYPNPNNGRFIIEGPVSGRGNYNLSISNVLGQKVYSQTEQVNDDKLHVEIVAGSLTPGMYFLEIVREGKRMAIKQFVVK